MRWHKHIPRPPAIAYLDLVVNGSFVEGARLVEDVHLQFWPQTIEYGRRHYFVAKPGKSRPAPWSAAAGLVVLPHLEEL